MWGLFFFFPSLVRLHTQDGLLSKTCLRNSGILTPYPLPQMRGEIEAPQSSLSISCPGAARDYFTTLVTTNFPFYTFNN